LALYFLKGGETWTDSKTTSVLERLQGEFIHLGMLVRNSVLYQTLE